MIYYTQNRSNVKTKKEPKRREYKDGEITRLNKMINRLKKDIDRLKGELRAYETAFKETSKYIDGKLDNVPLKNVIDGVKNSKKLKEIEESVLCKNCSSNNIYQIDLPFGKLIGCRDCNDRGVIK